MIGNRKRLFQSPSCSDTDMNLFFRLRYCLSNSGGRKVIFPVDNGRVIEIEDEGFVFQGCSFPTIMRTSYGTSSERVAGDELRV